MTPLALAALAAVWLLGLLYAARALRGGPRLADRVRDAIVIGVAIPFVLGFLHLLYWQFCWAALALCVIVAFARRAEPGGLREPIPYVLLTTLAFIAWPQLVQPLLDGDTLSYHLPNAAAWSHAHSVWTTQMRYWWYPPASELFASALYAVSTPFALGWSGVAALALLGLRLYAWAREGARLRSRLADVLAASVVAILPLALQAGTLQNDVWLAAFFVEILWSAPVDDVTVLRSAALCALVKPDGWVYAAVALAASRARPRAWATAGSALALWLVHDAALWHGAFVPPESTAYPHLWRSTMLAHPALSLREGFVAFARIAPFGFLLVLAALASPRLARDSPIGSAGIAAVLVALVMPFGFGTGVEQLASGASLRYFAPAMAAGAIAIAPHLATFRTLALRLLLLTTVAESLGVLATFWSDRLALAAIVTAIALPTAVAIAVRYRARVPLAVAAACAIVLTTLLGDRQPAHFFADALAVRGQRSGVYAWIARLQPARIAGWGLRIGTVDVLSPHSVAVDVPDADPCGHARRANAMLVASAEATHSVAFNQLRIHDAALCGTVLYRDPVAIAVEPAALP